MDEFYEKILGILEDAEDTLSEKEFTNLLDSIQERIERIYPDY